MSAAWKIVGGSDKGGILVRAGKDLKSAQLDARLSTGAEVEELELTGSRLHYKLLTGTGPAEGWISTEIQGKTLAERLEGADGKDFGRKDSTFVGGIDALSGEETIGGRSAASEYPDKSLWTVKPGDEVPPALPAPPRPAHLAEVQKLPPWSKPTPPKGVTSEKLIAEVKKGDFYNIEFPFNIKMLMERSWGAAWLTKAFHAAGTMPKDNSVQKIVKCKELPFSGYDAAGGAGMKGLITVEYAKPDPNLHTDLFVKVPFNQDNNMTWRMNMSFFGDPDGGELSAYQFLQHMLPFRTPKMYFVDISRATTNYIIVTEQVPFMPRGSDCKPYEIIPTIGKYQDYELKDACQPIYAMWRALARHVAWDKQGRYDSVRVIFEEHTYARSGGRDKVIAEREKMKAAAKQVTAEQRGAWLKAEMLKAIENATKKEKQFVRMLDQYCHFMSKMAKPLFPGFADAGFLDTFKKQMLLMNRLSPAIGLWISANDGHDDLHGLMHPNPQIDNAFFWTDEEGMYHAGFLDWGGCGYYDYSGVFLNIVSTAQAKHYLQHEEKWIQCFVDECRRWGGPVFKTAELLRIVRLAYAATMAGALTNCWINVNANSQEAEWEGVKDKQHEVVMDRWNIRCAVLDMEIKMPVWRDGPHFQTVLDWAKEMGLPTDGF